MRALALTDVVVFLVFAVLVLVDDGTARMVSGPACALFIGAYVPLHLLTRRYHR